MTTLDDFRVGVVRESMTRNRLIAKDELGKPKKTLFNNPPADLVFGMPERKEEESVRDVVFMWKDGETTLDGVPGPDFRAMDKGAVGAGLTRSTDFRDFRRTNPATLRTGRDKMRASRRSMLPSDRDPMHTYGCPSSYKPLEEFRRTGEDCSMQDLIQGRFQYEWVQQMPTGSPGGAMRSRGRTTVSKPTLAQLGHQKGAEMRLAKQAQMAPEVAASQFKMSKFLKVESKVKSIIKPAGPKSVEVAGEVEAVAGAEDAQ